MGRPRKVPSSRQEAVVEQQVSMQVDAPQEGQTSPKLSRSGRRERTPINGLRDKLTVRGMEPGWHYCFVNDYNVDEYLEADYEFVTHAVTIGHTHINNASQTGGRISRKVGNGVEAFLMRIPEEIYLEDQRALDAEVDEGERSLMQNLNTNVDGRYGTVQVTQRKPLGQK